MPDLSPVCFGFATTVSYHKYFIQLDRYGLAEPALTGPEAIYSGDEFQKIAMRSLAQRARADIRDGSFARFRPHTTHLLVCDD
jgi:hypothetical protein